MVSSGGMLLQKLDLSDLQTEKGAFDGSMVYAQNKRQQVVMTRKWAQMHKNIFFASMHPGNYQKYSRIDTTFYTLEYK